MAQTTIAVENVLQNNPGEFQKVNDYIWIVDNISEIGNEVWSPAFYTSPTLGYRLRCKLVLGEKNVGVNFQMVKGSHDKDLDWPFCHHIQLSLLNQVTESKNITNTLVPEKARSWSRPETGEPRVTNGIGNFFRKSIISGPYGDYETDYTRNNRIYVKISAKRGSPRLGWFAWIFSIFQSSKGCVLPLDSPLREDYPQLMKQNIYIFAVENVCGIITTFQSDHFNTCSFGYRIQLEVKKSNEWLGVFFRLVPGEYDKQLHWPFKKNVEFSVINQVDESESRIQIFTPDLSDPKDINMWKQPAENEIRQCFGFSNFMSLRELRGSDDLSNFLRNDRVLVKVKLV